MSLSNSNLSRASSRRNVHTSTSFAGSMVTNGSNASSFFPVMAVPNCVSRSVAISVGVMAIPLCLHRFGAFLVLLQELDRLLRVGQFQRQKHAPGARGNRQLFRLTL